MALPGNQFSPTAVRGTFLTPDDLVRTSLLVDYEMGGVAIGDPSQGLQVQAWEGRVNAGTIQVRPYGVGGWTDVTSDSGITEIAIAFDQNMRATTAYVASGVVKLYWFDSTLASYTTTSFAGITSPALTMDDKRAAEVGLNDVLFFYIKAGRVCYRQQRDRYATERDLGAVPTGMTRILRWGFTDLFRVQLEFGVDADVAPAVPATADEYGGAFTDTDTDTLYFVSGTTVVPLFAGTPLTGRWRGRVNVHPAQPSFAWGRLVGDSAVSALVRLYGDGVLVHTQILAPGEPFRIEAERARTWEIDVESSGSFTGAVLANTAEELISGD